MTCLEWRMTKRGVCVLGWVGTRIKCPFYFFNFADDYSLTEY